MPKRHTTGEEIEKGDPWVWLAEEFWRIYGDGIKRAHREMARWAADRGWPGVAEHVKSGLDVEAARGSADWDRLLKVLREIRAKINAAALNSKLQARDIPAFTCASDGKHFFTQPIRERQLIEDHRALWTTVRGEEKRAFRILGAVSKGGVRLEIVGLRRMAVRDISLLRKLLKTTFDHWTGADGDPGLPLYEEDAS